MTAFPLTGPHRASGHASNVFRRSAAHNFGVHATPAVVSRQNRRGFQQSHAHPEGRTSASKHQGVDRQIAIVEPTEPTMKNRCPDSA
jgi:hypothetical protein